MLRGTPRFALTAPGGASALPPTDSAYASEPERPPGIRFYWARESFFLPYSLLQSIRWKADRLTLLFVTDQVTIEGQGLHALYVAVSEFKVARICEQEDAVADEDPVHVTKIERMPMESTGGETA